MIICPSCDSENPGENRFCQKCGHPLQTWRAFLVARHSHHASQNGSDKSTRPKSSHFPVASAKNRHQAKATEALYLDSRKRYQLQESLSDLNISQFAAVTVLDCHPAQASPISEIQADWLQNPDQDGSQLVAETGIPPEAVPYLALQADFFPIVPELHHAWTTRNYSILLLEDRSRWPLLLQRWQEDTDLLQKLSWLYEMTLLWDALSPWQCQNVLLTLNHLRIDQDQVLCLEHLNSWQSGHQPELKELGHTWQALLQLDSYNSSLEALVNDLASGHIKDTEVLKHQLAQLADCAQPPSLNSSAPIPSTSPSPEASSDLGLPQPDPAETSAPIQSSPEPDLAAAPDTSPTADSYTFDMASIPPLEDLDDDAIGSTHPFQLEESEEDLEAPDSPTMVLPMKLVQVSEIGRTYVGRQRDHNEDCYYAQTNLQKRDCPRGEIIQAKGIYILCDGMGGHASGEVASELAVKTLMDYFAQNWESELPSEDTIRAGIAAANQAIYDINQAKDSFGSGRMGTTLVMVLLHNTQAAVVHVGDSRLYTYNRRAGLNQITVDHEVGQREIQRGVEPAIAYARPDAYQLTQALGPRSYKDLKPDISYIDIVEDTLFLLCSDGLSDNDLLERNYATHIEPLLSSRADLEEGIAKLMNLANNQNGHDNITTILVRVKLKPNLDKLSG